MSRESEKALREMQAFLENHHTEITSEEEINDLVQRFMVNYNNRSLERVTERTARTADDYLELAEEAPTKAKAEKYIRKALELDPDNLDAVSASLDLNEDNEWEYFRKLSEAVRKGTALMEQKGFMDEESIGSFWGILETRPYMRLRNKYMEHLVEAGMMGQAVRECEEMIRLCKDDNLGVRFRLMHLYAFLEMEEPALALYSKYDAHEETQLLLPLSILYFKKGDYKKAETYLRRLVAVNKDTKKFFRGIKRDKLDRYVNEMSEYGFRPFTIEELLVDLKENSFLFWTAPVYLEWAYEKTRGM